jgi:hypothetical protein
VREAIAFLLLACACGAATWSPRAASPAGADDVNGAGSADPAVTDPVLTGGFATLEARAASLAPGMRLAAERESSGERIELLRAGDKDTCARVAFEASEAVIAKLVDSSGLPLAEMHAAANAGELGERGPVCVRKGDAISASATGAGARVRWIAWALP